MSFSVFTNNDVPKQWRGDMFELLLYDEYLALINWRDCYVVR